MYRDHCPTCIARWDAEPPANLSQPILKGQPGAFHEPPAHALSVVLDGEVTSPSSGWEPDGTGPIRGPARWTPAAGPRCVNFSTAATRTICSSGSTAPGMRNSESSSKAAPTKGRLRQVKTAKGRIVEIESPLAGNRFRVTIARDGLPPALVPAEGWIELTAAP